MRRSLLEPVRQQTLCIFCAARRAQRRTLHTTGHTQQQAVAAVRSREQEHSRTPNKVAASTARTPNPQSVDQGDSWGTDNAQPWSAPEVGGGQSDGLSAEERRIRQRLEEANRPRPPPIRNVPFAPQANSRSQKSWQEREQRNAPSADAPSQRPMFRIRRFDNPGQIPSSNAGPAQHQQQWSHLRRRNGQQQSLQENSQSAMETPLTSSGTGAQVMNDYARQSQMRQDQTRSRQYVGFDGKASMRCFNCGQLGHSKAECPNMQSSRPMGDRQSTRAPSSPKMYAPESGSAGYQRNAGPVAYKPPAPATPSSASAEPPVSRTAETTQAPREQVQPVDTDRQERRPRQSRFESASPEYEDSAPRRRDDNDKRRMRNIQYERQKALLRDDEEERADRRRQKDLRKAQKTVSNSQNKQVSIPEFISIGHLATLLSVRASQFERSLKRLGFTDVNHDHVLNAEDASLIAQEYDFDPVIERAEQDEDLRAAPEPEDKSDLPQRPPVVTIMGHVDHGKTTILDYLRKSSIAASEHGGITQHIGAFSVPMASGRNVTFLDTPGHAAFLTMRQRGANVTDIVVLVVAADDSVMPQTIESIRCAKTAGVPIIVAINKCDKEDAAPERVKQDLARHGVEVEDFGGETQVVQISGKTGLGMRDLEETIATLSEILDQRAASDGVVEGWILEASTKKSGRVATVLVKRGTMRVGDIVVAGTTWARVRTMRNEFGALVEEVGPGMPVEIDGWRDQPSAGDEVLQARDEQKATAVVDYRTNLADQIKAAKDMDAINEARRFEAERRAAEEAAAQAEAAGEPNSAASEPKAASLKGPQEVHFVIKADVSGSVEAVLNQVSAIGNSDIRPVILHSAVGPINQSDVERAAIAQGYIVAFNTSAEPSVRGQAERSRVGLIEQSIIYRVTDEVKALLEGKLPPEIISKVTGEAEVAQPFSINIEKRKFLRIAGSKVKNGTVNVRSKAKVLRAGEVIYTGTIENLKNKKQDVSEMRKGTECGIAFEGWEGFEVGDLVQCFEETERRRTL